MEDEGFVDDDFIDDTAREFVGRYGLQDSRCCASGPRSPKRREIICWRRPGGRSSRRPGSCCPDRYRCRCRCTRITAVAAARHAAGSPVRPHSAAARSGRRRLAEMHRDRDQHDRQQGHSGKRQPDQRQGAGASPSAACRPGCEYSDLARHPNNETLPGVLAFRPEEWLIYVNADAVLELVLNRLASDGSDIRLVVCDLSASPYVDLAGSRMLHELHAKLSARG